ncbi:N-acetyl-gamma-glutamyl-phosphate reductase [Anaerotalea alkaliphila]|uniref:N-acetyl-gamma-glutamyl-phosphate reductase n=1 Tax=Anaerotalea alkaliphila TaxID=2662126 RepID=A0A7X5HV32_9FIRM|nr:N-acetyl-gamma-glutamyl-phosphate reductase [Anaerotalea alkaliphila]NDL67197.1 N-acetyl-gamma-glutamyl-phosphate reductase [Anaerotalea alkaliphila]
MRYKIYVDGQHGTTGLRVHEYLERHPHVEVLQIDFEQRRDQKVRAARMNEADLVVLCLPEAGSREAVGLVENPRTKIIDASTEFRTNDQWAYGLPELSPFQREKVRSSNRVSVPGCHASAAILALGPLVREGIVPEDYPVSIHSITGYSGGGKQMIHDYEQEAIKGFELPRPYALGLAHKHLPEMKKFIGLAKNPIFMPIVGNFYKGLAVTIPLRADLLAEAKSRRGLYDFLSATYGDEPFVEVVDPDDDSRFLLGTFLVDGCNDTNRAEIFILGNDETPMLVCRLDNLGKGASGAAIQNMNLMLDLPETTGLV